jgi:hypothetical protein
VCAPLMLGHELFTMFSTKQLHSCVKRCTLMIKFFAFFVCGFHAHINYLQNISVISLTNDKYKAGFLMRREGTGMAVSWPRKYIVMTKAGLLYYFRSAVVCFYFIFILNNRFGIFFFSYLRSSFIFEL